MTNKSFIRQWVLRTVAKEPSTVGGIHSHFTAHYPDHDLEILDEVLQNKKDISTDDQGRVTLTESARRELEQLGEP